MKTTLIGIFLILFSMNGNAQNQNTSTETKTTVTTTRDNDGEKKLIKKEQTVKVQNIEMKEPNPKSSNIEMKETPVEVTTTTKVINPDGSTRTVSIDRSGNYMHNGKKYKVTLDARGYTITSDKTQKPYLLRATSTNSYIFRDNFSSSLCYFDTNGDLIIENYDPKSDAVISRKFTRQ